MERLLDPAAEFDLALFEAVVASLSSPNSHDIMRAQDVLVKFKAMPQSFFRSDFIISQSQSTHAKMIGLQIMEEGIMKKWNTLDDAQKNSVKAFLIQQIVQECTSWSKMRSNRMLLTKLNASLVAIAKREWPLRWPSFVQDVASSASVNEPMIENNIQLLTLLGEDIFEFGEKGMTSRWAARKKAALQADFEIVYSLLVSTLTQTNDTQLLNTGLKCFTKYIPWIPYERVLDPAFLEFLADTCVGQEVLRAQALRCLTEIASLPILSGSLGDQQKRFMVKTFRTATQSIMNSLPTHHSGLDLRIARLAELDESAADVVCQWLTTYLRTYLRHTIHDDILLRASHEMLIGLTHSESKEIFKSCVEYWWWLGDTLLRGFSHSAAPTADASMNDSTAVNTSNSSVLDNSFSGSSAPGSSGGRTAHHQLKSKLHSLLSNVRFALIKHMARPEEVIIVEDEGELRRETMTDVESLQLYQSMREALIFLTHLDAHNTFTIMTMLMAKQLDRSEWSWRNCSTLCWAVGSISGSMSQEQEKDLFVAIMTDLLKLCKEMVGKENRAVIASNIMYVVGQYPRFLRNHTSFMRTVCRKLFEFMRELFPGVQDMAVDTFLKLTKLCPEVFLEAGTESQPFILSIFDSWLHTTELLTPAHKECLFGAVGYIIAAQGAADEALKICAADSSEAAQMLLLRHLHASTCGFQQAVALATENFDSLATNADLLQMLLHILRTFSSTANSCGPIFIHQMQTIILGLQQFYSSFSSYLTDVTQREGPRALELVCPRRMRLVKREILKVFELFIKHTTQEAFVAQACMPQILDVVLTDYVSIHPLARDAGVLALVSACVHKLGSLIEADCPAILEHTFAPTVALLVANMADFPEHRVQLFKLLHTISEKCFSTFLAYLTTHEDVVSSILWATKHQERTVMLTGLELLQSLLVKVVSSNVGESFYSAYMHRIFTEVLVCAMDTLHTSGFALQCNILQQLFQVSKSVPVEMPVVGANDVLRFLSEALKEIPTLVTDQISGFVERSYATCDNSITFRQHMADFMVEVQIWGAQEENAMLHEEERQQRIAQVAGLDGEHLHHRPQYAELQQPLL